MSMRPPLDERPSFMIRYGFVLRLLSLAAIALLLWLFPLTAHAQIVRNFTPRFSTNDNGDILLIGNTVMSCNGGGTCTNARNGTGGSLNSNDFTMVYVDIDANAGTFSSSNAQLAMPAGVTVLWAGLYWSGDSNNGQRNQVMFSTPVAAYATLTATQLDVTGTIYQGYVDVTARVQAGGNGTYTAANVRSTPNSANKFAGWSLVVAYRNSADPPRNLVVYDGYAQVAPNTTVNIGVSGFLTPPAGAVNTRVGVVAGEGDLGYTGDALRLNGTTLSDARNPANNFFNSSISRLGVAITAKNPNYVNQLGWDVDLVAANGVLANSSTSATITLLTTDDRYYPGVVTFATDLYQPILSGNGFTKSVTDVNGAPTRPGDVLEYLITTVNTGNDAAINVVLRDTLPANANYVPGSLTVVSGANAGAKSDAAGDDQMEYDAAGRRVIARLGTGANAANGGSIGPTASTVIRFRATVAVPAPNGSTVSNQAALNFNAAQLGTAFATLSDGDIATAGVQRTISTITAAIMSGTVFEDVNYGGGAGRTLAASSGVGRPSARVELYDMAGAYLAAGTTDAAGLYAFDGWAAGGYTIRVVNSTVSSSRTGWVAGLLPVQTLRTLGNAGAAAPDAQRVGGEQPALADAPANTTNASLAGLVTALARPQSVTPVTLTTVNIGGLDFGYNFDTIVNVNDAGQGSLRQFLLNANALANTGLAQAGQSAGVEASIFMVSDGAVHPGLPLGYANLLTAGVARITPLSALPAITGAATRVDGATQTSNVGDLNAGLLNAGGAVGVDGIAVNAVAKPEVELRDGAGLAIGLDVAAAGVTVRRIAILGFGNSAGSDANAGLRVAAAGANALIESCALGVTANTFADPGAALRTGGDNLRIVSADDVIVRDCAIGFAAGNGVALVTGAERAQILNSEIRGNAIGNNQRDGVSIESSGTTVLTATLISNHEGGGVDARTATGTLVLTNLTVTRSGLGTVAGTENAGIRLGGSGNRVDRCVLFDNAGAGVMVASGAATNQLTRNSIYDNGVINGASGQIGIDLQRAADDVARGTSPFVTINDLNDTDAGGNGLINFPVIESAAIAGSNLTLSGWARPGSSIELFVADPSPSNFGEGRTWVVTLAEGSGADLDATTSAYSGAINGVNQGADNTNRFRFVIPTPGGVAGGVRLTATATVVSTTSEFSGLVTVSATIALSGYAYSDLSHNAQRDAGEPGTGVALFAKLVAASAPAAAQQVSAVDPSTGGYAFGFVATGSYSVLIDDNAVVGDILPAVPAGWLPTEAPSGIRSGIVVTSVVQSNINFGFFNGSRISGRVVRDDGAGGGVPNDGAAQAGEAGVSAVEMRALSATCAGGACDSTLTDGAGAYTLWVPFAAAGGTVGVAETNPSGWLSTGGGAGSTGGSYSRTTDRTSFTMSSGQSYTGLVHADVPGNAWNAGGAQSVAAGAAALYRHTFTAGSAGTLTLSFAQTPTPAIPGWSVAMYRDLDCDGVVDAGEPPITATIALATGQSLCVLVRHDSPAGATNGASETLTLSAAYAYANAAPALAATALLGDVTTVSAAGAGLQLSKTASVANARPGDLITYTVTYFNPGGSAINAIVINDATPAYTTFTSASNGTPGTGIISSAVTQAPASGASGPVQWTLTGSLAAGGTGTVSFTVRVR